MTSNVAISKKVNACRERFYLLCQIAESLDLPRDVVNTICGASLAILRRPRLVFRHPILETTKYTEVDLSTQMDATGCLIISRNHSTVVLTTVVTSKRASSVLWVDSHPWLSLDNTFDKITCHMRRVELLEFMCSDIQEVFFIASEFTEQEMRQLTHYEPGRSHKKEGGRSCAIDYFSRGYIREGRFSVAPCMGVSDRKTFRDYMHLFLNFQHSINPSTLSFDYEDNSSTVGLYAMAMWLNHYCYL